MDCYNPVWSVLYWYALINTYNPVSLLDLFKLTFFPSSSFFFFLPYRVIWHAKKKPHYFLILSNVFSGMCFKNGTTNMIKHQANCMCQIKCVIFSMLSRESERRIEKVAEGGKGVCMCLCVCVCVYIYVYMYIWDSQFNYILDLYMRFRPVMDK